jgi:lon-related putative ATP-dependent protease
MASRLTAEEIRRACDITGTACLSSREMEPLEAIIGQERAVRSLRFGIGMRDLGFNVYVSGIPGTGKTTAVKRFLQEEARDKAVPNDLCYVNNFRDPTRPKALSLPAGKARQFQRDMKALVEDGQREIRRAFESDEYAAKREEGLKAIGQEREALFTRINARAQEEGFVIQSTPIGLLTIPVRNGRPLGEQELQGLDPEALKEISARRERLQDEIKATLRQAKALEKAAERKLRELDRQVGLFSIGPLIEELMETYGDLPAVVAHLKEVQRDILENLSDFRADPEAQQAMLLPQRGGREESFRKYEVNVLVDNGSLSGKPVVIEMNPTYNRLFGRIDKEPQFGTLVTDFTMIAEGSLHQANGGYLVIPAEDLLVNLFSWESLKRALRNREISVEEPGERLGFLTTKGLRPEPIPLDTKVILIGTPLLYYYLYSRDEDFAELFKVKADFDTVMDRTEQSVRDYGSFVSRVCTEEGLKHLDASALAKIVEYGSRLAEDQDKLSTRFGEISDILREAGHYASEEGAACVSQGHVRKAIEEKVYRSSLLEERIREMIIRGTVLIDLEGEKAGQVNGLAVYDLGDIRFGRPNRISASIGLGQSGLVDIEREARLGGPIHTKGVMILSGFLLHRFAQDKPLTLSARLVFEQSYSGVDGDSASSAELYAILSSLSGLPVKQGIAVTGSINQRGEIQAIGGANEKIEGFFEVCKARGLTGEQGVIIPESNVRNLMLKEEVVEAVRNGTFHVWSVRTVDEGIRILTGVEAGERAADGSFPEGTVNGLADRRLRELAEKIKTFGGTEEKKDTDKCPADCKC